MNLADLERALGARDRRAIARAISAVESETADAAAIRAALAGRLGHARVLGVTGPPGAGQQLRTGNENVVGRVQVNH